ncbi:MAG: putative ABC transporter permease [Treponema sp.]|nr:putative ABC transporter permease [Treponema sp.]
MDFINKAENFAPSAIQMLPLCHLFLIFLLYSFIGWCSEVLYVGVFYEHKFINRGFLHGPICPVYGFGGLVVMMLPEKVRASWITLFVTSMALCSFVEYVTSWQMEKIFKMKWWDYSERKFNINGRVCLLNSTLFGVLGLVVVRFVQPFVDRMVHKIDSTVTMYLADGLAFVFIVDVLLTIHKLIDFSTTMAKLKEFGESLRERYAGEQWFISTSIADMFASIKEHAAVERNKFSDSLMQKIDSFNEHHFDFEKFVARFPRISSLSYRESLALVKQRFEERVADRKAAFAKRRKLK